VSSFDVLDAMKELRIASKRPGDGAQAADVFGVTPGGVVPAAIAM
jgi:hypothetical protein